MVLSRLVVTWLDWIIEIGLWLFLVTAFVMGFWAGDGFLGSLFGGIFGVLVGGIFAAVLFGFFIVLSDIRRMMKQEIARRGGSVEPQS